MASKRVKWGLFILAAILLLAAVCVVWVYEIGHDEWQQEREAVQKAYQQSILYSASRVQPFVSDKPYMVVFGKDKLNHDMLVWVSAEDVHVEYASDGITMEDAAAKVTARDPANRVIRTLAGKWLDDYAWEVYYTKTDNGQTNYYYDYYRFSDGKYLDTYHLSHR